MTTAESRGPEASPTIAVSATPSAPASAGPFAARPKALPAFGDHFPPRTNECRPFASTVAAVDLNKDGRKDLVVHQWCSAFVFGAVVDTPPPDALSVYLQRESGAFELANIEVFGRSDVRLIAATRKVVVADFNADGYPDLAYAVNWEDGRAINGDVSTQYAQSAVVMSEGGGRYRIDKIGKPAWFHAVDAVRSPSGGWDVIFGSFGGPNAGPQAFRYGPQGWTALNDYPNVSGGTFRASEDGRSLLTGGVDGYGTLDIVRFSLADGKWSRTGVALGSTMFTVPYRSHQGLGTQTAVRDGSRIHVAAGYDESCLLKLTPDRSVYLMRYTAQLAPADYDGTSVLDANSMGYMSRLDAFDFEGALTRLPSIFVNEDLGANFLFFGCEDVNGDGFGDVVISTENNPGGTPTFYLNDRSGRLVRADASAYPKVPDTYGRSRSIYEDFDGDGIRDLLLYPLSDPPFGATPPLLYKGLRRIDG